MEVQTVTKTTTASKLKVVKNEAPTIGSLIADMAQIERDRAKLSAEDKKLSAARTALETELIALLKAQKTDKAMHGNVTATYKVTARPKIVDDALLWKYTKKHDYFHLYYRRLNQTAYDELCALNGGKPLPGTEIFEDESISLSGAKAAQ